MQKIGLADLSAFVAIAERSSFAKAALHLGVSRSTVSEILQALERKLGVRLLNRTTRSVALTEAGERLLAQLRPMLDEFDAVISAVGDLRDKPAGTLRLTVPRPAASVVIEPILARFLKTYPDISLEISVDSVLRDIVRDRFDAGIRPAGRVEKDMIALRLDKSVRMLVVASPDYLAQHGRPRTPHDLAKHNCLRARFTSGVMHSWTFERRGKTLVAEVGGSFTTTEGALAVRAALDGVGITRVPETMVNAFIESEQLVPLLEDWASRPIELFLYYPGRRQVPPALQAFINFVRPQAGRDRTLPGRTFSAAGPGS